MRIFHSRHRMLAWAFLMIMPLFAFVPAQAQQPKDLVGFIQLSGAHHIDKKMFPIETPYTLTYVFGYLEFDVEKIPAGGVAVFGLFESDEVKLLAHVPYAPNIAEAMYHRELFPPGEWLEPTDMPRFVMICGWPLEGDEPATKIFHTYAERDDSRTKVTDESPAYIQLWMTWRSVSSKRAENKFEGEDYCGEIAAKKASSAPLWLPYTTYQ